MAESSDARARRRMALLAISLLNIPCYCIGFIAIALKPSPSSLTPTASPTLTSTATLTSTPPILTGTPTNTFTPTLTPTNTPTPSAETVRREFDALILRMLLEAGALPSTASREAGSEWSVMGGTLTQMLASELAGQMDLGLGRLLLANEK